MSCNPPHHQPVIIHLDMDAFFASVEQRDVPILREKPVIVGGEREGRGIVSAASYEAREYGIHSAMSMHEARARCPHGVFIAGNWAKYVRASLEVFATCQRMTPSVEIVSVDECAMRLAEPWEEAVTKARTLAHDIQRIHGLDCSLGIAPNRLLAKLASSLGKPRAFTVLHRSQLPESIADLPARALWGVGEKTACVIRRWGIETIGDLVRCDFSLLRRSLGDRALTLVDGIRGAPDPEDEPIKERSLGHEYTFGHDVAVGPRFWAVVARLSDQVSRRLRIQGYQASVVRVRLRWANFETHSTQARVDADLQNPMRLHAIARRLLRRITDSSRLIRLVGVTAAGLYPAVNLSFDEGLFPDEARQKGLVTAVDTVWNRYGEDSLIRASSLL